MTLLNLARALLRKPDFRFFLLTCALAYICAAGVAAVGGY